MEFKIVGLIMLMIGAIVTFAGRRIFEITTKQELSDKQEIACKLIGFLIVLSGALLIFGFGGRV